MFNVRIALLPLLSVMVFALGCDFVNSPEAREALDAGREAIETVQESRQQEDGRPPVGDLKTLQEDEIAPRERELRELHEEIAVIEREKIRPLERQLHEGPRMGATMLEMQREFEARFKEIETAGRAFEAEFNQLDRENDLHYRGMDSDRDGKIRALEDERIMLQRELDSLYRGQDSTLRDLYEQRDRVYDELNRPMHSGEYENAVRMLDDFQFQIDELNRHYSEKANWLENELRTAEYDDANTAQYFESEMNRLYGDRDRVYRESEVRLSDLYRERDDLYFQLDQAWNTAGDVDVLYADLEWVEREIARVASEQGNVVLDIENRIATQEQSSFGVIQDLESWRNTLWADLDYIWNVEWNQVQELWFVKDQLHVDLNNAVPGSNEAAQIETKINQLYDEIVAREYELEVKSYNLEIELSNVENELSYYYTGSGSEKEYLWQELDGVYAYYNGVLDDLYWQRDNLYLRIDQTEVKSGSVNDLERRVQEVENLITRTEGDVNFRADQISQEITAMEYELSRLSSSGGAVREREIELERLYNSWSTDVDRLYIQQQDLENELYRLETDTTVFDMLQQQAWELEDEIARLETEQGARVQELETRMWGLDDQVQDLYYEADDRRWAVEDEFTQQRYELEARRMQLEEKRWALEDEAARAMETMMVKSQTDFIRLEDKIEEIYETEIRPREERIYELEDQLAKLGWQSTDVEFARDRSEPVENEVESGFFQLLGSVLDSATNQTESAPAQEPVPAQ